MTSQFVRFIAVGLANLVLSYAIYLLTLSFVSPFIAMLLASVAGMIFTSILNVGFVFRKGFRAASLFVPALCYVLYTIITAALVEFAATRLSIPAAAAPIPVLCIMVPLNFICMRFLLSRT